ncbi:hypothetical protein BKA69DRAFT_1068984 [Paraphysoderma sedebokerense]|nr:hypothetical protein BKA69DRAFT_1068984 [Paraphysoderma sedebokerense]
MKKEKMKMAGFYYHWKASLAESRRIKFAMGVAAKHHQEVCMRNLFWFWRGYVENNWKRIMEKKIRREAEKQIAELARSYEDQIAELTNKLSNADVQLKEFQRLHERNEEEMKKAFMRGISALNMEAMNMFKAQVNMGPLSPQHAEDEENTAAFQTQQSHMNIDPQLKNFSTDFLPSRRSSTLQSSTSVLGNSTMRSFMAATATMSHHDPQSQSVDMSPSRSEMKLSQRSDLIADPSTSTRNVSAKENSYSLSTSTASAKTLPVQAYTKSLSTQAYVTRYVYPSHSGKSQSVKHPLAVSISSHPHVSPSQVGAYKLNNGKITSKQYSVHEKYDGTPVPRKPVHPST